MKPTDVEIVLLRRIAEIAEKHLDAHDEHDCGAMGFTKDEQETETELAKALAAWRRMHPAS